MNFSDFLIWCFWAYLEVICKKLWKKGQNSTLQGQKTAIFGPFFGHFRSFSDLTKFLVNEFFWFFDMMFFVWFFNLFFPSLFLLQFILTPMTVHTFVCVCTCVVCGEQAASCVSARCVRSRCKFRFSFYVLFCFSIACFCSFRNLFCVWIYVSCVAARVLCEHLCMQRAVWASKLHECSLSPFAL